MSKGGIYMTLKEISLHEIMCKIAEKRITQADYKKHGIRGVISKQCGAPSNHKLEAIIKKRVLLKRNNTTTDDRSRGLAGEK
jgi:S-ribosylhomocysteine lyase LuxS involved in autoinducer biosynthesis